MKHLLLFFILLIIVCSCALRSGEEKLIEAIGDELLKNKNRIDDNYYIGVSSNIDEYENALTSAIENAKSQISQNLGFELKSTINTKIIQQEINSKSLSEVKVIINNKMISENFLSLKLDKIYWEKWRKINNNEIQYFYKVWVGIPFSKKKHKEIIQNTLSKKVIRLSDKFRMLKENKLSAKNLADFYSLFSEILQTKIESKKNLWINESPSFDNLTNLENQVEKIFSIINKYIKIEIGQDKKSQSSQISITASYFNEPIPNFPIQIINEKDNQKILLFTNSFGQINQDLESSDYDRDFIIYAGKPSIKSNYKGFLPNCKIEVKSLAKRENISLYIDASSFPLDSNFANEIKIKLQKFGYSISQEKEAQFSIIIKSNASIEKKTKKIYKYFIAKSSIKIELINTYSQKILFSLKIPNSEFQDTRGFAKSEKEALLNSLNLKNLGNKNRLIDQIIYEIDTKIKTKQIK